jgi:hypothetical protein
MSDRDPAQTTHPMRDAFDEALAAEENACHAPNRRADRDVALLDRPELRPVRLQLEYLKPELAFERLGIRSTIVAFGSTTLIDPEDARRQLAHAEDAARRAPHDETARAAVERARLALSKSHYYAIARELGRLVGRFGQGPHDHRLVIATGGGPGAMEAANRGAHDVGAVSIGLNIALPQEQQPNPYITPALCFEFRYFALRKLHFAMRARALVAFPGGYGTFDELFEILCLIQTGKREPLPVILVGAEFWRSAIDFDFLVTEGMIQPAHLELFEYAESAHEIMSRIEAWYASRGRSIVE